MKHSTSYPSTRLPDSFTFPIIWPYIKDYLDYDTNFGDRDGLAFYFIAEVFGRLIWLALPIAKVEKYFNDKRRKRSPFDRSAVAPLPWAVDCVFVSFSREFNKSWAQLSGDAGL
jgi:hypothetical protein